MKGPRGESRSATRRLRARERRYLRRHGYVTEWALERWRWRQRRDALKGQGSVS